MAGTSVDTSKVISNVSELLENTVNISSVFYDIFLNPSPMDVELTLFNSDNTKTIITIPNRVKDRQLATQGVGSPEGNVSAGVGQIYIDSSTNNVYIKAQGTGALGWVAISSQASIEAYLRRYLSENSYMTEAEVASFLINNNYITKEALENRLNRFFPPVYMNELPGSGVIFLEDNSGNFITPTGDITFILPTITDLTILHRIFIQVCITNVFEISVGTSNFFDTSIPDFESVGSYNLMYEFDNASKLWYCGWLPKGPVTF